MGNSFQFLGKSLLKKINELNKSDNELNKNDNGPIDWPKNFEN
jgi:hypothetical protein